MIKFFRKIRYDLMGKNKTVKYLLYAIGEIILVVIGILIALQINNNNELRKQKGEETKILLGIKEDFIETRKRLIYTKNNQLRVLSNSRKLINAIETEDYSVHPDSINHLLAYGAFSHHRDEAIMGSYDALIGAGKTSIVENQNLLNALADFSSLYRTGFEDQARTDDLFNIMYTSAEKFYPSLRSNTFSGLRLEKRYTTLEKEMAITQLYENESFLMALLEKTKWENERYKRHNTLLQSLNNVLFEFNFDGFTPVKDFYNNYTGTYKSKNAMSKNAMSEMTIGYEDGSLNVKLGNNLKEWKMVQVTGTTFHTISWASEFKFIKTDNSKMKLVFESLNASIELDKVEDNEK